MRPLAIALVVAGCSAGSTAPSGQPAAFVQSNTADPSTVAPANLTCLGTFHDPAPPASPTPVTMTVRDFEQGTPVAGATLEVYTAVAQLDANQPPDAKAGPSAADGTLTVTMPAGHYRVIFHVTADPATTIDTFELDRVWNDPDRVSVSQATKSEIPAVVSILPDDTKGVVAGDLRDCDDKRVGGVLLDVKPSAGAFDAAANTIYFVDAAGHPTPARAQKWTSGDGVFATLNVPPGDATLTATGLLSASGAAQTLATAVAPVRAGAVTVVQLEPLGK